METWIWALINLLYWVNWQTFNNSIWIIYQYGNNNMAQIDHLILCIYAKVTFQKHQSNSRKHRPPGLKRIMALRQANSAGSMFSWRNLRIKYSTTSGRCDPEKSKKYWALCFKVILFWCGFVVHSSKSCFSHWNITQSHKWVCFDNFTLTKKMITAGMMKYLCSADSKSASTVWKSKMSFASQVLWTGYVCEGSVEAYLVVFNLDVDWSVVESYLLAPEEMAAGLATRPDWRGRGRAAGDTTENKKTG